MPTWQPNAAATTDTTAVHQCLEKHWAHLHRVQIKRLQAPGVPMAILGEALREASDTPATVIKSIQDTCDEDSAKLTGEQRYEIVAILQRKPKRGSTELPPEENVSLGRLRFGTPDAGGGTNGAILKEVTGLLRGVAESNQTIAEADGKRLQNLQAGFDLQTKMMEALVGTVEVLKESNNALNANAVKALELTLANEKDQRQERREDRREEALLAAEERDNQRVFGLLTGIGRHLSPHVPGILQAFAYKIAVDAAVKAKQEGVTVEAPKPADPPPPEPEVKVKQESHKARHFEAILERLGDAGTHALKTKLGEDLWSLLINGCLAATDDDAFAAAFVRFCTNLRDEKDKLPDVLMILGKLPFEQQAEFDTLAKSCGIDVTVFFARA